MSYVKEVENTPNPHAMKFILSESFQAGGGRQFTDPTAAKAHPLANALFGIPGVEGVFLGDRFITVAKGQQAEWGDLKPIITELLEMWLDGGVQERVNTPHLDSKTLADPKGDLFQRINAVIDERVRPALENDGGGLQIVGLEGTRLTINYQGACVGCPGAKMGTLVAIQNYLRMTVDPRIEVVSV